MTVFSNGDGTDYLFREVPMAGKFISRGFKGRRRETDATLKKRIPPGQYETKDFPVLSAGPTPRTSLERWDFSINGEIAEKLKWTCDEFQKLPRETVRVDIHCVTKWSKLDTV
jgi:DMSO/TMAO reductase YedYZ molybdopterin-dependent catalytic subunit